MPDRRPAAGAVPAGPLVQLDEGAVASSLDLGSATQKTQQRAGALHQSFMLAGVFGDGLDGEPRPAAGAVVSSIGHGAGDIDERTQRQAGTGAFDQLGAQCLVPEVVGGLDLDQPARARRPARHPAGRRDWKGCPAQLPACGISTAVKVHDRRWELAAAMLEAAAVRR